MGCIGMGMEDFCQCTPSEFMAIHDAWLKHERQGWEQSRMVSVFSVAPWSKRGTKLTQLIPFPWDMEKEDKKPGLSKKERESRYKAALARYGLRGGSMAGATAATADAETTSEGSPQAVEEQPVDADTNTEDNRPD